MSDDQSRRGMGATSLLQLIRERRTRDNLYGAPDYWDARTSARLGLARSIWPSNVYNEAWDRRQREVMLRALGDVSGRRVADVGCGTGRMPRFFASCGAKEVVGIDFSEQTVKAAEEETARLAAEHGALPVRFVRGDVMKSLHHASEEPFDDAISISCFSVACSTPADLEIGMRNVADIVRPGGRVLLFEPIHRSPVLRRRLNLGVEEWIACANRAGLLLIGSDRMGMAPLRFVLSVRDLPRPLVDAAFDAGEAVLDRWSYLAPLSDYKLLLFERHGG
jgi:SAM-dependent methyltransferase